MQADHDHLDIIVCHKHFTFQWIQGRKYRGDGGRGYQEVQICVFVLPIFFSQTFKKMLNIYHGSEKQYVQLIKGYFM